jgi:pimeloyl-ACP methyl ester carboxylesterase
MIPGILSQLVVSKAKGISKVVLGKLLKSIKGENTGIIVPYRSEGAKNIICFVHGFCGDPSTTFNPMPEYIIKEKSLRGWDVISIGYSTDALPNIGKGVWASSPDISKIAGYLRTNLDIIFKDYKRVALIGHSMGGLVIQRAILNMSDIHKISHVLFFGTPSGGLKKAWFMRWFKNQIDDMDNEGGFIKKLRKDWDERFFGEYPFKFATLAGELDEFVPTKSSLEPFPIKYWGYTAGNHVTMVKPKSKDDTSFQVIRKILRSDKNYLMGLDEEKLNNLVADYYDTIDKLAENPNKLTKNGLREYIFALEGTGKIDLAIKVIEESEIIKANTDLMGILGGRWKRKFLLENNEEYLNLAIGCYSKALNISVEKNESSQIYYHAINLAFLYLMQNEDNLTATKQMAELAIKHCEINSQGQYWESATRAEAYLYLNNFEESKKLYKEAIEKCNGDIRAVSSMMINAIYACNSLNRLDWKKELENVFVVN